MDWYVNWNGQIVGPVDEPKVVAWIRDGQLLSGSICAVGSREWTDLAAHPAFATALRSAAPPPRPAARSPLLTEDPRVSRTALVTSERLPMPPPSVQASGPGPTKSGRWLVLIVIIFALMGISASGAPGLVIGTGFIGWGVFAYKHSRRSAVELVIGRIKAVRWAAALTMVAGALFAILGLGRIGVQHEAASRRREAAAEAQKQAAQEDAQRKQVQANLVAAAPAKAAAWRATLHTISSDIANVKSSDELHRKFSELTALGGEAKTWLGQLDAKPPDATTAESEIEAKVKQIQPMVGFIDDVAMFEGSIKDAKALIAKHSWLEADHTLDVALQQLAALQTADPSFQALVAGGFDAGRKKAEVTETKTGIAGAVAGAKRQQAAAEAAEKKRAAAEQEAKAKAEAYLALCGSAPVVSSWDGELIGLTTTIKRAAHDPGSIDVSDCTKPALTKDNCWVSTCSVRGKNAFGALILLRQTWSYSTALGFRQVGE